MKQKNGKCKEKLDCCYDIDLLSSISALLKMASVQDQVYNSFLVALGKKECCNLGSNSVFPINSSVHTYDLHTCDLL